MLSEPSKIVSNPEPAAPNPQPPPLTVLPEPHPAQTRASKPKTRNGKIARLPKLERDMVNRMLADAIPYDKIAQALDERGFKVTPRNVSNWATRGGYHQWCLDQALVLDTRLQQDTLTDFIHPDPTRLPEVGLQIMATRFSQILLRSNDLDPKQSFPVLAMLCRVSNEILKLHKFRDRRCTISNPGYLFEREKKENTKQVETVRKVFSGEPVENGDNDPPPPKTIGELLQQLRAIAPSPPIHPSAKPPFSPGVPSKPSTANLPPATPAPIPRRPRKPKNQTSKPENSPSQPATCNVQPSTSHAEGEASSAGARQIQNQNSKIENTPAPPSPPQEERAGERRLNASTHSEPASIQNQKSKIENPPAESQPSAHPVSSIQNPASSIQNPASEAHHPGTPNPGRVPETAQPSTFNLQPSTVAELTPLHTPLRFIDNVPQPPPPQQCPKCQNPLEYFRDGSPPEPNCPKCTTRLLNLYGDSIERCPACHNPLPPLLANGLRPKRVCAVCGCGLSNPKTPGPHPPPLLINARFCIHCRTPIPWQCEGARPSARCAKCRRALPRIVYSTGQPVSPHPGNEEFNST